MVIEKLLADNATHADKGRSARRAPWSGGTAWTIIDDNCGRSAPGGERGLGMGDVLQTLVGEVVVLDTRTPIVYLGRLVEVNARTFVLEDADMHDCRDGHATKECYLAEVNQEGVTVNRRRVIVMRNVVISVSRLADVVQG